MLWDIGNKKSVQGVVTGELLPLTNNEIVVPHLLIWAKNYIPQILLLILGDF